jgi:hypothetical protein
VHAADPDPKVLAYQYLQALPQIAAGQSNKLWIIPAEMTKALEGIGGALTGLLPGTAPAMSTEEILGGDDIPTPALDEALEAAKKAAEETEKEALATKGLTAGPPISSSSITQQANELMQQTETEDKAH